MLPNHSSLSKWNNFLTQNGVSDKKDSLYGPLSDYLSIPSVFDTFNFFEDYQFSAFPVHNFLHNQNTLTLSNLLSLTNNPNLNPNLFLLDKFYNSSNPTLKCEQYLNDIKLFAELNHNVDNLLLIFPEKTIQFEYFEFSGLDSDSSLYEILSTPDSKIYYPEPFMPHLRLYMKIYGFYTYYISSTGYGFFLFH
jgi:hypothetical protein